MHRRRLRAADLDVCNVGTLICHVADIAKCRAVLDLAKDFACRASSNLLNRRVTLHRYELTHRRYANRSAHSRTLARTGRVLCLVSGRSARATVLDFLAGVHDLNDRSLLENLHQGRPARMGQHHPHLQHLHLVQDSRPSMVVDSVDAHPLC